MILVALLASILTPAAFAYDHCGVGLVRQEPGKNYREETGRELLRKGYSAQYVDTEGEASQYSYRAKVSMKCEPWGPQQFYYASVTTFTLISNETNEVIYQGSSPVSVNSSCEPELFSIADRLPACESRY